MASGYTTPSRFLNSSDKSDFQLLDNSLAYSHQQSKLTVNSVSKHYRLKEKTVSAISNVSFQVNAGDICVLLGPSGCGKSTLLRMIAGLLPVSSGEIMLAGKPVSGPGKDRGMIFQSYTSFPWLTVQENVEYGLRVNGYAKRERREIASHFIERVNLTKFRDAFPEQLSGGMRQRVAIARTLANGPEILFNGRTIRGVRCRNPLADAGTAAGHRAP